MVWGKVDAPIQDFISDNILTLSGDYLSVMSESAHGRFDFGPDLDEDRV